MRLLSDPRFLWSLPTGLSVAYILGQETSNIPEYVWYFNNSLLVFSAAALFASSWVAASIDAMRVDRCLLRQGWSSVWLCSSVVILLTNAAFYMIQVPIFRRAYRNPDPQFSCNKKTGECPLVDPEPTSVGWTLFALSAILPILISFLAFVRRYVDENDEGRLARFWLNATYASRGFWASLVFFVLLFATLAIAPFLLM